MVDHESADVKVTVVVPVWNAGAYLDRCVDSLLAQTLPRGELELIFVDDGSTDDSGTRLEALAARHDQVQVITIPNSGWPGKPRNVGTDAAQGAYVMYVDQDDMVEPEALQRMYDLGSANDADVVLGKVTSDFRGVNHYLYREQRPRCTVYDSPLINSQTPHKMLRTDFLRQHQIRYPEGPRRLEDQLFITRAYFAARSASIVADYVCYRYLRRPDGGNAGSRRIEPVGYYQNLREVLDVIDEHTDPGEVRDRFYRRFIRVEALNRLGGSGFLKQDPAHREASLAEVAALLSERVPVAVDTDLPPLPRVRAALTRTGSPSTLTSLERLAKRVRRLRPKITITASQLTADGLMLGLRAEFWFGDGPLLLEQTDGGSWALPRELVGPEPTDTERRLGPLDATQGDLVVRQTETLDEWFARPPFQSRIETEAGGGRLVWRGTARLDPATAAVGGPLPPGRYQLWVRLDALGISRAQRVRAEDSTADGTSAPMLLVSGGTRTILKRRNGTLGMVVGASRSAARRVIDSELATELTEGQIRATLPVVWTSPPDRLRLLVRADDTAKPSPIWLAPDASDATRWVSDREAAQTLPTGRHAIALELPDVGRVDLQARIDVPPPRHHPLIEVGRFFRRLGRR